MQKKQKSVGKNAILNAIKAALSILFPIITFPYATRVLGVDNIGKVNYSASIVHYFQLIALLGISTYAVREGAKLRDNKKKLSAFSNEVFTLNVFTTLCAYVLMSVLLFISVQLRDYALLIILQSTSIIFITIGVDWLNTIYEDFLFITIRSIVTNILSMVILFVLVKKPEDYYIYAFLTVFTNIVIGISNIFYCRRYVKIHLVFDKTIFRHLRSSVIFFANSLAVTIYVSADTTMLGWMKGEYYVGIYAVAVKVYNIIKTILAALYVVTIPRLSYYAGNNQMESFKKLYSKLITYLSLIVLPCIAGLVCLSEDIVVILSGEEYIESVLALQILSIGLMFAVFGGVVTNCLNIPLKREMINLKATSISAVLNIVLNIFFIKYFYHNGAAITTVISELTVFLVCVLSYKGWKNIIDLRYVIKNIVHAVIGMILIFVICFCVSTFLHQGRIISVIIKIVLCCLCYAAELIIFRNECVSEILNKIIKKKK